MSDRPNPMVQLRTQLVALRVSQGLTQEWAAARISALTGRQISTSGFRGWESGRAEPKLAQVHAWAESLGWNLHTGLSPFEPSKPAPSSGDNAWASARHQLVRTRKAAGWTQKDVAAALDVTGSTVSNWESARTAPHLVDLARWAKALFLDVHINVTPRGVARPVISWSDARAALDRFQAELERLRRPEQ